MSCFDTLIVTCPKCASKIEFQPKNGQCEMENYDVSNVPPTIAEGSLGEYYAAPKLSTIPWDALHEIADILCITGQYDETVIVEEVKKLKATAQQAL